MRSSASAGPKRVKAGTFVDELTEVLTHDAFLNVARHFTELSLRGHVRLLLASIEVPADREARELLLIQAAEVLRMSFGPPSVIGRWDRSRFCVITAGLTETTVEAMLHRAAAEMIASGVRFAVTPLDSSNNLEEALAGEQHARVKTAILAD